MNNNEKASVEEIAKIWKLCSDCVNQNLSCQAKFVIAKPECFYIAETKKEIKKQKQKFVRKTLGPNKITTNECTFCLRVS